MTFIDHMNDIASVIGYLTVIAALGFASVLIYTGMKQSRADIRAAAAEAAEAQHQLDACRETVKYVTQPAKSYREPATELLALVEAPTAPYVTVPARSADRWPTGGGRL